jgi:hypothetical protein
MNNLGVDASGGSRGVPIDLTLYCAPCIKVMSRGTQPYDEFQSIAEVVEQVSAVAASGFTALVGKTPSSQLRVPTSPQVKSGYKLHCPPECPKEVYERLMWPCWAADPRERPGFRELRDALLDLGVVAQEEPPPVDDDAADTGRTRKNTLRRERAHSGAGRGAPPPDEWSLRGPSVHHVASVLVPRVYDLTNDRCGSPAAVVVIQNVCSCLYSLC